MDGRIGFSEIVKVESGIVFSSVDGEGLYFLEKGKTDAVLIDYFPEASAGQEMPYKAVIPAENKIVLPPRLAEDIAVFDCGEQRIHTVTLAALSENQKSLCKFWTSIAYHQFVYFIGHYYPAMVKMNLHTGELFYLTDWVQEIERRRKIKHDPYLGIGVVRGDAAVFPCCCANAVLWLDLKTDRIKIYEIETDIEGFNGVCLSDDRYWLTSRNNLDLVIWDKNTGHTERLKPGEENLCKGDNMFAPPLQYQGNLYLLPNRVGYAYRVDTGHRSIQKLEALEHIFNLEPLTFGRKRRISSPPGLADGKIIFITAKDNIWHAYDPALEAVTDFSVRVDTSVQKEIKKRQLIKYLNQVMDGRNGVPIWGEEEMFLCRDFGEFICRYEKSLAGLQSRFAVSHENIGRKIYNCLAGG